MQKRKGYIAVVLDEQSRDSILQHATHGVMHGHHMTIAYEPTVEVWEKYESQIGSKVTLTILGVADTSGCQVLKVDGFTGENLVSHVTVSTDPKVKPGIGGKVAAELLKEFPVKHITGTIQFVPHHR